MWFTVQKQKRVFKKAGSSIAPAREASRGTKATTIKGVNKKNNGKSKKKKKLAKGRKVIEP